jgi:hypothetical protein
MIRLSVNVNKVATLRNSRGGEIPSVVEAVRTCIAAGAPGITVHPRGDQRHITPRDVRDIAAVLAPLRDKVEFNIEGDPRADLLDLVCEVRPHQCTLVPVKPGEITSQAGWGPDTPRNEMLATIEPACASACSSTRNPHRCAGRPNWEPTGSNCTQNRMPARTSAARRNGIGLLHSMRRAPNWPVRWGWGSMRATISISKTW